MKKEFISLLQKFVSFRSVSTDPSYKSEVFKTVQWLSSYLSGFGLKLRIIKGYENPVIIAKTPQDRTRKTILIYGHYDVQPADKADGWKSDPFTLTQNKGKFYARGVADNKAQILAHVYAVSQLLEKGSLGFNVIFLIEGNEETGSAQLGRLVKENKKMLMCDCIVVSDSELATGNTPALDVSFRGSGNFAVTLETGTEDAHSGLFGGVTPNAAEELSKILGNIETFVGSKSGLRAQSKKYETRRSLDKTVEVTGLSAGYIGDGFRNSIPCRAHAKINVRSSPTGDIKLLMDKVQRCMRKHVPSYARIKFVNDRYCSGIKFDVENIFARRARKSLREIYGYTPRLKHGGGTLPIASTFAQVLRVPQVMVPLADENCGAHSASEHMSVDVIEKGIAFSLRFFSKD